jgi:hypothetical protein
MQPGQYPDAIDTRLVVRIYGWITITSSVFLYPRQSRCGTRSHLDARWSP